MFPCEYCEIFKKSFLIEHLWWLLLYCKLFQPKRVFPVDTKLEQNITSMSHERLIQGQCPYFEYISKKHIGRYPKNGFAQYSGKIFEKCIWMSLYYINPLSVNPTKWSNTPKQFVATVDVLFENVFEYFVGLALKG